MRFRLLLIMVSLAIAALACNFPAISGSPTPALSATPADTATATPSPTPVFTPTSTATATATPTTTPTATLPSDYLRQVLPEGNSVAWHTDGEVWAIAVSPDGARLAAGTSAGSIYLWEIPTGAEQAVLSEYDGSVYDVYFGADSNELFSFGVGTNNQRANPALRLWDLAREDYSAILVDEAWRTNMGLSPDHSLLALDTCTGQITTQENFSFCQPYGVQLIDIESGEVVAASEDNLEAHVWSFAFTPDGRQVVYGAADGTISRLDIETGHYELLDVFDVQVIDVAFSPDGRLLAAGLGDGSVRLWEASSWRNAGRFDGHSEPVTSVAFSPDGLLLASGSVDETVRVWDLASSTELAVLESHHDIVTDVAFSRDGGLLFSASYDGTVRVWGALP